MNNRNPENAQQVYLDNNSTTIVDPAVADAMSCCLAAGYVNPASQHRPGQTTRRLLEEIREEILLALGAETAGRSPDRLIFTSGGTESNNLALIGLAHQPDGSVPNIRRILISAIEHPSVTGAGERLRHLGFSVEQIAVDSNGVIKLSDLKQRLREPARLVSVMLANNETGAIQPVAEIAAVARAAGALIHCDAVQAVGKIPVNFRDLKLDAMTLTAHKFHGPRGIGALLLRDSVQPFPILFGGFQQLGFRPGTEDVVLAVGFREAIRRYATASRLHETRLRELRDRLQRGICDRCDEVFVVSGDTDRVPHTLSVSFKGINRQEFLMAADLAGVAISTGSACASGSSEPSLVLRAMGLEKDVVEGAIRISVSALTTDREVDLAIDRMVKIANDLRHRKSRQIKVSHGR